LFTTFGLKMACSYLAFIFGLIYSACKDRIDGIGECRLEATVIFESANTFVVVVEVVVDACVSNHSRLPL